MRIARMIDSLTHGGVEKGQITFATELHRRGMGFTLISLGEDDPNFEEPLRSLGMRVEQFQAPGLFNLSRIIRLTRFLKQERFDVLQTHLTYANIIGAIVGKLSGTPTIATLHSAKRVQRELMSDYERDWIETLALRFGARRVVAVGHMVAQSHQRRLPDKPIHVIPNAAPIAPPLSPDERDALRRTLCGGDASRPIIIAVGRLTPAKGYSDLLTAFARLHQSHPTTMLLISGDGELFTALNNQITELGLVEHVQLLGYRNDIPRLLRASDLFVSSSHWEGLSWALLEAMGAGLPVVATAVGEVPKVLVSGTGIMVPTKNPDYLAETLRTLLDDPARMRALGMAAARHVEQQYSVAAWVDQHLALYRELTG